jgi:hypothetical protein
MIARIAALALATLALCFCAFVFDAASSARYAARLLDAAGDASAPNVRALLLQRTERTLAETWSQPLAWHAGAMEVRSGASALAAALGDDAALADSVAWAERSVQAAPAQPLAWLRLGAMAQHGYANALCGAVACLDRSWASGPTLPVDDACVRLQNATQAGMPLAADGERIAFFMAARPNREAISRCLAPLAPEIRFQLMLQAREAQLLARGRSRRRR